VDSTTTFDTDQVELQWKDNRWQLFSGSVFLKDFGRSEIEGRVVLRLVRDLHLNSRGTVGVPHPIMEYWLVNGEPPRGPVPGLRTLPLGLATLRVEQVQGQWCLRDAQRILFNFGQQADVARQGLAIIQRYGFTHVGYVGLASPVMLVFLVSRPTGVTPVSATVPTANTARSPVPSNHLPRPYGPNPPNQPASPTASVSPPGMMPAFPFRPLGPTGSRFPGSITPVGLTPQRLPGASDLTRSR
jgi:hypothetical protein